MNCFSQILHLRGFSPVWVKILSFNILAKEKFTHTPHVCGFSPVCTNKCSLRCEIWRSISHKYYTCVACLLYVSACAVWDSQTGWTILHKITHMWLFTHMYHHMIHFSRYWFMHKNISILLFIYFLMLFASLRCSSSALCCITVMWQSFSNVSAWDNLE